MHRREEALTASNWRYFIPGLTFSPCGQTLKFAEDQVVLLL